VIRLDPTTVLAAFAIFCRIGACLMIAPGFSSSQIAPRFRLYIALAVSLALTPLLIEDIRPRVGDGSAVTLVPFLFAELAKGLLIGFLARIFFAALQFILVGVNQFIGLGAIPGTIIDEQEQMPALATLFTLSVTTLMFVSGLHIELMRGLVESYSTIPPGPDFGSRVALVDIADQLGAAFLVALRIGAPFIIYSVIVNFAMGIANKLTPLIPVFFIGVPFVMFGGLVLILIAAHEFLAYFESAFAAWLTRG
jgi:flagellar biosynthetic protein FliR